MCAHLAAVTQTTWRYVVEVDGTVSREDVQAAHAQEKSLSFPLVVPRRVDAHSYMLSVKSALKNLGIRVVRCQGTNANVTSPEVRVTGMRGVTQTDISALSSQFPVTLGGGSFRPNDPPFTPGRGKDSPGRQPNQRQCNASTEDGSRCERAGDTQVASYVFCWQHRNTIHDNPNWRVNLQHFP